MSNKGHSQSLNAGAEPLYRTVPIAAMRDLLLYEKLALVDALRDGRTASPNWSNKKSRNSCARRPTANRNLKGPSLPNQVE